MSRVVVEHLKCNGMRPGGTPCWVDARPEIGETIFQLLQKVIGELGWTVEESDPLASGPDLHYCTACSKKRAEEAASTDGGMIDVSP